MRILDSAEEIRAFLNRADATTAEIEQNVKKIIADVRNGGDNALVEYTKRFDGVDVSENMMFSEEEIRSAYEKVSEETLGALRRAKDNIMRFHKETLRREQVFEKNGKKVGFVVRSVSRAGLYVPGGKAAYPSSLLMCACPALAAGVDEIIACTPAARVEPLTLVAAAECGITKIYKIGGAQAIAAMAYGTETVPKADVISGPGNIYVATAKREVFGQVGIDSVAGPSEILIIADDSANPEFLAADVMSQAEHDERAMCIVVCLSRELAEKTAVEVERILSVTPRKDIARKAISDYGTIIVAKDLDEAAEISNEIAPEHLELCVADADKLLAKIKNAGAVFMGNYSPEPLGDYYAGPNHVLPTNGTAKFFSALSCDAYIKKISVIEYDRDALVEASADIIRLAETEGLFAHADAVRVRLDKRQ